MTFSAILIIFLSAVLYFGLGMLWYSPFFLGKQWARLMQLGHLSREEMSVYQKSMRGAYLGTFFSILLICFMLWLALGILAILPEKTHSALLLGFLLWLGFIAPLSFSDALFDQKPFTLWAIGAGYHLVGVLLASVILLKWG